MLFPFNGSKPETLTADLILKWANEEAEKFENLIKRGNRGERDIRVDECHMYHAAWLAVVMAGGEWEYLSPEVRGEVMARYYDELS